MEKLLRLHLGSGRHPWPGWVNIDSEGCVDIKHDVMSLPMFEDETVDEIQAIHLFEHLPRLEIPSVLAEWHRILKTGDKLIMEMPSLDKIAGLIVKGEKNQRLTLLGIFGDPRDKKPNMMHQWAWTNDELKTVLKNAGFSRIEFSEPVFHIPARDFRVKAIK